MPRRIICSVPLFNARTFHLVKILLLPMPWNMATGKLKQTSRKLEVRILAVLYSCSANGQYNVNLKTLIDNVLASGERCLGIVGYTTASIYVFAVSVRYDPSNYSLQFKNTTNSTISETSYIYYLVETA